MAHYAVTGEVLADDDAAVLPRTRALLAALRRHRDFTVIDRRTVLRDNGTRCEGVVVDVQCDEVPGRNPYDIEYTERLLITVEDDSKRVPSVDALREGFPRRLAHQHQRPRGSPARLCLYFESDRETLRSFTPERFLQRIQWWLAKSARGELHPADQPLENMFFSTGFELVLPWNLDALLATGHALEVRPVGQRTVGGTFRLQPRDGDEGNPVVFTQLTLAPVLAGAVEFNCDTLGDLDALLTERGAALLPALFPVLRGLVGPAGAKAGVEALSTMFLIHVPVCRNAGEEPERVQRFAFLMTESPLEIGLAIGALSKHDKTIYSSEIHLQPEAHDEWRALTVAPIDVVQEPTSELLRAYAGIADAGPRGVFLGAGTLGGSVLALWGRNGWGEWTPIDKDHVRPHNLGRHVAFNLQIGMPKAHAIASLHAFALPGATPMKACEGDPLSDASGEVAARIASAEVVIDATANVDYGRLASEQREWPRHVSIYLTPSGNASIALVEDANRRVALRTLEAQSYRAIIQTPWGAEHVQLPAGRFWSGASCRDLSTVMAYSQVMVHAATIAEQVPALLATDAATIRVWQQTDDGGLQAHAVEAHPEIARELGDVRVFWDEGLEAELRQLRTEAFPNETGGVLLGYWDFNRQTLVIAAALPAPRDSKSSGGSFERGTEALAEAVKQATERTAGMLGYVGEWHSHPRGHDARPSADDVVQLVYLALGMAADGLPAVQLIVGETEVNISHEQLITPPT